MEFRRISNLPPYVFTIINNLKIEARRAGVDVIDLGFGNPDIPSPQIAVDKLAEAAHIARNHRYSLSRGLPKLREAVILRDLKGLAYEEMADQLSLPVGTIKSRINRGREELARDRAALEPREAGTPPPDTSRR